MDSSIYPKQSESNQTECFEYQKTANSNIRRMPIEIFPIEDLISGHKMIPAKGKKWSFSHV